MFAIEESNIVEYEEFRAQLAEMREHNSSLVFDYESPKGNKDARSHIYKLRQTKSAVDSVRKAKKQASLEYGKRVDEQAKEIILEIESMIDVHQSRIDEIANAERERSDKIKARVEDMRLLSQAGTSSAEMYEAQKSLQLVPIDDSFAEFVREAAIAKDAAMVFLAERIENAVKKETEAAEAERRRRDEESRRQSEREAQIRKEAEERARREAEERAQREREAAERRELELKLEAEKAKREAADAEHRARQKIEAEEQTRKADEARRLADHEHRQRTRSEIALAMGDIAGVTDDIDHRRSRVWSDSSHAHRFLTSIRWYDKV